MKTNFITNMKNEFNKTFTENGAVAYKSTNNACLDAFGSLGAEGQVAFNNLVVELGKLDTGILRTNSQMDKLFTTFSNTFR